MEREAPIRVLIAKVGLDGHDRGAKVVVLGLREQGIEVIYPGLRQTPEQVVERALKEKVEVIGLSCLSEEYNSLFPKVVELAKKRGMDKVLIIGGGIISKEDIPSLYDKGIKAIFGPGTSVEEIANYIRANVRRKGAVY